MSEISGGVRANLIHWLVHYDHLVEQGSPTMVSETIDQILAIENLAIVDRDAELPTNPWHQNGIKYRNGLEDQRIVYERAQQDMLKAGWVREIKGENQA